MMKKFMVLLVLSSAVLADDKIVRLEGIKIQADDEAPQVMYIIPWQNPKGAERLYSPVQGKPTERIQPLDPYRFAMEQNLYKQWRTMEKLNVNPAPSKN